MKKIWDSKINRIFFLLLFAVTFIKHLLAMILMPDQISIMDTVAIEKYNLISTTLNELDYLCFFFSLVIFVNILGNCVKMTKTEIDKDKDKNKEDPFADVDFSKLMDDD